mmetsp:Transcript_16284/g.20658  ORF Transcript_16284/g.20658 Transcript_16284/m.20658 type:complete len:85 (-) Transcript_16284:509-763(-)
MGMSVGAQVQTVTLFTMLTLYNIFKFCRQKSFAIQYTSKMLNETYICDPTNYVVNNTDANLATYTKDSVSVSVNLWSECKWNCD